MTNYILKYVINNSGRNVLKKQDIFENENI